MRKIYFILILVFSFKAFSQQEFKAIVENESTGLPMSSVHVLNLTKVIGVITNQKGEFEINAELTILYIFLI